MYRRKTPSARVFTATVLLASFQLLPVPGVDAQTWESYGGEGGRQYTALDQITPENVNRLEVAWRFRTGDLNQGFERKRHSMQVNPVMWEGVLYISTSANWVLALDARTGEEIWRFDPQLPKDIGYSESGSRGVSLWHGESADCPDRVFIGTLVGELYALDAKTGVPCVEFGDSGKVDMATGVGEVSYGDYSITSPPAVLGDLVIVGSAIGDNRAARLERGVVRALNVRSGDIVWLWDPIPDSPAQPNYDSWENDSAIRTGAANVWPPISVDKERNLVFVSTGSPSPDFYGGERLGNNNYANSLVALNGSTGEISWQHQLVHHDVWDYDIPSQPTLTEIEHNGARQPAVVVVTKTGMLYAFHRQSGEPIYAIVERTVPDTAVPGERLSPTQPFSSFPPLADQRALSAEDAFGISWFDRRSCVRTLRNFRSEGIFTPPSLEGTVMNPSYAGGSNWGGIAIDQERQIGIVNVNQIPALVMLIPRDNLESFVTQYDEDEWEIAEQSGTPYYMARRIFLSSLGLPCTRPPWNKLVAVNLASEELLWEVPLGTIRDLAPAFVPNYEWGVPGMGGPLITKSGLIVIGAVAEHVLRIFDINTGEEIWRHDLPTAAMATPMSYDLDGVQYIAVAVGGHDNLQMERGDYLYVFKLTD